MTNEPTITYQNASNNGNLGKLRSTVNLNASVVVTPEPVKTTSPTTPEPETITWATDKPFTFEELKEKWEGFSQQREQKGGAVSEQIMLNREFKLEGTTIELILDNLHQETLLNEVKPQLLGYLRRNLQNREIQITHRIAPNEVKRNPYTPQEKFNSLAERNPALLDLQRLLGLDVDF